MNVAAVLTCVTPRDTRWVAQALSSITAQTSKCHPVIVLSDSTVHVASELRAISPNAQIEQVPLTPPGVTRNAAVARVSAEWIAFLDADDIWLPPRIETQLRHAQRSGAIALGSRQILIDDQGKPFFYAFSRKMPLPSSWLIKRDLLVAEPFSDRIRWEDAELWRRFRRVTKPLTTPEYLVLYRVHAQTHSSSYAPAKQRKELFARAARFKVLRFALLLFSRTAGFVYRPI